ncbi:cell wall metabolism sensor histidine kinase WalK [Streptomyces sp. NBC_00347]|uniref:sensor histidine kinase n=1 Tax=Streptomyces sp. NBC_00347 TaxID=2975721 RepID=UPI00224DDF68|nr:HAMP domain-containing sensor histidine kinase [Streptomyces sp. NBC_00347]MCX5128399.1 HAMP domain-containing histidine kinase [Streptomyces sp. NBC_00347]
MPEPEVQAPAPAPAPAPGRTSARWLRLPTRARTALAAGTAALVLSGAGAWWLHHVVHSTEMDAARGRALAQSRTVALEFAGVRARDREATSDILAGSPVLIIGPDGPFPSWLPQAFPEAVQALPAAPASARPAWATVRKVRFGAPAPGCRADPVRTSTGQTVPGCLSQAATLAGQSVDMAGTSIDVQSPAAPSPSAAPAGRYTVYVALTPSEATRAADALVPVLAGAVPLAALAVALSAWVATTRALRPVEAIRSRLATVDQPGSGTRVPVPAAEDEITRLARTTNHTLDVLDAHARRQHRFIADAAHELRSPVTGLRTVLEVAVARPERPAALNDALRATTRLQYLVDDLLTLARLDNTPAAGPDRAPVNFTELVRELLIELPHTRPGAPSDLNLDAPAEPVVLHGDRDQLRRLLRNLLDNAARHADTRITVTLALEPGWVECTVHNDGAPIAEADRERVFDRFTRLDEARTRDTGGSGLGLAIARDLARHHRGTLAVAPADRGTAFLLRLPR